MKRITKLLLALVLVLALVPASLVPAQAATVVANGTCGTGVTWVLKSDGVLSVAGSGAMDDYASVVNVPWADHIQEVKSISILPGVTHLGDHAFYGCDHCTYVSIPETVTYIGNETFAYCESLPSVKIPASARVIWNCSFAHCPALTTFTVDSDNPSYRSDGKAMLTKDGTRLIRLVAQAAKTYTIPDTVTEIRAYAFSDCVNITYLQIPEQVTSLTAPILSNCPAFQRLIVDTDNPAYTTEGIALYTRNYGTLLEYCVDQSETFRFPAAVTAIGDYAFRGARNLTSLTIPGNVTSLGVGCFEDCDNLKSVTIPASIRKIPAWAFSYCNALQKVIIPNTVTSIGEYAFFACCHMYAVGFEGKAPSIGSNAFLRVVATACHPRGDSSWTDNACQGYGGTLTWVEPVSITRSPSAASLPVGAVAHFTVSATGAGFSYQWQYNGGTGWKNATLTGCKASVLEVPVTAARNAYQYRCVVSDMFGHSATTSAARLTVKTTVTAQPAAKSGYVGDTAKFTVKATGAGLKYQWQYNGGTGWKSSTLTGCKTAAMSVPVTAARNGYSYRCVITDANGAKVTTSAARLTVKAKITAQPAAKSGYVGDTAKFTVKATGAGLKYQWQYNGGTGWKASTLTGCKTAAMSVPVTAARNGYSYRCVITDASGAKVTTSAAKLTVKTKITAQPQSVTASVGAAVKFTVKATGAGLTYQWQFKSPTGSWSTCTLTGAKTAVLSVPAATVRNGFSYRCVITDANGAAVTSAAATLTVK